MMSPEFRMDRAVRHILASGLFLSAMCLASRACGYPTPTFSVEDAGPRATHIVLATEGDQIDGRVTVVESWKGDLKFGEVILVPEMTEWTRVEMREVLGAYQQFYRALNPELVENLPTHVSCKRVVLFLVKEGASWKPASKTRLISMSAAWIEDGYVLTYAQHFNPGPLELCPLYGRADAFRASVTMAMHRLPRDFRVNDRFIPLSNDMPPTP